MWKLLLIFVGILIVLAGMLGGAYIALWLLVVNVVEMFKTGDVTFWNIMWILLRGFIGGGIMIGGWFLGFIVMAAGGFER